MHISWGYRLLILFILFAGMIGWMVYRSFSTNIELVEKDYYKSELIYQDVIDGATNAAALSATPSFHQIGSEVVLELPAEMKNSTVSGNVLFYCAYDATKDKVFAVNTDHNGIQHFGKSLQPAAYTVKIKWTANGKNYYCEKKLTVL